MSTNSASTTPKHTQCIPPCPWHNSLPVWVEQHHLHTITYIPTFPPPARLCPRTIPPGSSSSLGKWRCVTKVIPTPTCATTTGPMSKAAWLLQKTMPNLRKQSRASNMFNDSYNHNSEHSIPGLRLTDYEELLLLPMLLCYCERSTG